ncbi:ABC transporter ATP-binding protein [Salipiger pacificus]|nr:ABC transporter ATP-binding protein [Alloyangia pacifica]MCA0946265.1 ABC transporter ATP-binding protein [Alloyangia pacifica]
MTAPLLHVRNLSVTFPRGRQSFKAVDDVSFDLGPTEALGLVGESGSGKTTIGRAVLRLLPFAERNVTGETDFHGRPLTAAKAAELKAFRAQAQMVFQDPVSSFNPRRRIEEIVAEGLRIQGVGKTEIAERVDTALAEVGMSRSMVEGRRPHQFSGGQCQRIAIARALALRPEMLVCDEPVASLDVSVQARVLNLLRDMRRARSLAMIFISHDLAVVRSICDRIAVLYMGRIVEIGDVRQIFERPAHPYTRTLLDAVPVPDARAKVVPSPERAVRASRLEEEGGCAFRTRCPFAQDICARVRPELATTPLGQQAACHFPLPAAAVPA